MSSCQHTINMISSFGGLEGREGKKERNELFLSRILTEGRLEERPISSYWSKK